MVEFRDITQRLEPEQETVILEGFIFKNFDTRSNGWYLVSRETPTPEEKSITENIPYSQGILDFSEIAGQRFFSNRELSYTLLYVNESYAARKEQENMLKRSITTQMKDILQDTHDSGLHWLAKVKEISVTDDSKYSTLSAAVTFDAYPFAFGNSLEGSDVWDDVYFPSYVFQKTSFTLKNESKFISLINMGDNRPGLDIDVTGTIYINQVGYTSGTYENIPLDLNLGNNNIYISGTGTIAFKFYREVMI